MNEPKTITEHLVEHEPDTYGLVNGAPACHMLITPQAAIAHGFAFDALFTAISHWIEEH